MTTIQWHQPGDRVYEAGLDRGVLYVHGQTGVAWNGLTSLDENDIKTVEPIHYDGVKFNDIVTLGEFSGVIRAITYPDDFLLCEGTLEDQTGIFVTSQPIKRFNLCYRTKIGEGENGVDSGYKIHILYNLTAVPSQKTRQTLGMDIAPMEFEWSLTSIPEDIEGYRPTAHLIIDSRGMDQWLLQDIEDVLYGTVDREPIIPSLKALTTFIRKWNRQIIIDNGDGTWSIIVQDPSVITMISPTEFSIEADNVTYLNPTTYEVSSSEKNEEDI